MLKTILGGGSAHIKHCAATCSSVDNSLLLFCLSDRFQGFSLLFLMAQCDRCFSPGNFNVDDQDPFQKDAVI